MIFQVKGDFSDNNGNDIVAPENLKNVYVDLIGHNNNLVIDDHCLISDFNIRLVGDHSTVRIGHSKDIQRSIHHGTIDVGHNCKVIIGNNVTAPFGVYITVSESGTITIGDDSTFAAGTLVRGDDSHMIFDVTTGMRVNTSKDVSIGHHVWVGERAAILSGASVGDGSVVGFNSVVKRKFPNNVLIVGIPAKVVKKNIAWDRTHTHFANSDNPYYSNFHLVDNSLKYWQITQDD